MYEDLIAVIDQRDERIRELMEERDASNADVSRANERMQEWYDFFVWALDAYKWEQENWEKYEELQDRYDQLRKDWNKFTAEYNRIVAPRIRNFGRPLAASSSQRADVLERRKRGETLRGIADETGLGLRTVRTIIDKKDGIDRSTAARLKRIVPDKFEEARFRVDKKTRKELPRRIEKAIKEAKNLRKELKGLGAGLR